MRRWNALLILLLILGGTSGPATVVAQSGLTMEARAGFDGYYKVDDWLVVHVVVTNDGTDIEGELQLDVNDNWSGQVVYTQPAILPSHSRKQYTLYAHIRNYTRQVTVQLSQGEKLIAESAVRVEPLNAQDFLCGVVSNDLSALSYLAGLKPVGQGRMHVAHLTLSDLPGQGRTLGAMDALILHHVDGSLISDAQQAALRGWIAFGGHLIVVGGPNAVATAAGIEDLLPVRIVGSRTTTSIGGLGDLANAPFLPTVPAVVAEVDIVDHSQVRVMAGTRDLPLLVRRDMDRGRIDFLALDPDLEPVRTWIGNEALWPRIFYSTPLALRPGRASISWSSWDSALSNIPSLDLPPVLLVMAFLFFYIIVVGPLNLVILKFIDKRALAWITIPVLILLFSCVAYLIGFVSRGRKVIISEITIVRAQPASSFAAVDTFFGLYSPTRQRYAVRVPDNALAHQLTPAYGPANMSGKTIRVEQGPPTFLRDFEINIGEMRGATIHDVRTWQGIEADLVLTQPSPTLYHIEGTLSNRSGTTIRHGVLVFNSQTIPIGDLQNGETKSISADVTTQNLNSSSQIINSLIGSYTSGPQQRERERRGQTLRNLLSPVYTQGSGSSSSAILLNGLTLFGWLDESPDNIEIVKTPTLVTATTLLVARLPLLTSDELTVLVPKGFMDWQVVDGELNATPRELYSYLPPATFRFQIPGAEQISVDKLVLHVDSLDSTPYGNPPVVYIRDASTEQWQSVPDLVWGENELVGPQRFISRDGSIDVRVSPQTIQAPVSIDLTVHGTTNWGVSE